MKQGQGQGSKGKMSNHGNDGLAQVKCDLGCNNCSCKLINQNFPSIWIQMKQGLQGYYMEYMINLKAINYYKHLSQYSITSQPNLFWNSLLEIITTIFYPQILYLFRIITSSTMAGIIVCYKPQHVASKIEGAIIFPQAPSLGSYILNNTTYTHLYGFGGT